MSKAHYHVHFVNFSRNKGHNAVQKGAYRIGQNLECPTTGVKYSYAHKAEKQNIHSEMVLPKGVAADSKFRDPAYFFLEIQRREKGINARFFKEANISLHNGLSDEDNMEIARKFAGEIAEKYNLPTNISFHNMKGLENPHFHFSIAYRSIEGDKFAGNKNRKINEQAFLMEARKRWAEISNEKFKEVGLDVSVDHRSHEERGLKAKPKMHENKNAIIDAERQQAIKEYNVVIKQENLKIQMQQKRKELKQEAKQDVIVRKATRRREVNEMAAIPQRQQQQKKGPTIKETMTVHKLYDNQLDQLKEKYFENKKQHQAQKEKNKEHKQVYKNQRERHKERMGQSKGVVGLKKQDIKEMKLQHKGLKAELKGYAAYNPLTWGKRREIKKEMMKNKIQQKRKKLEIKQEKRKQKGYKRKFNEQKKGYRKEKRKELGTFKEKSKAMLQIAKLNREKARTKNMQIPGNVVSLKEYKQKFKVEQTKEQSKERAR
ncbi:hypothetical protein J2W44_006107 [Priestia aryabhattai]|uniref:MobA/MobL family protein n=1 Tax=Priestia aryabhattai TaxID=412384 RepID=UPI0027E5292A|nr:MobA/MobL family protein [Priestia aryabhattai]MDP9726951.1 hypothetical protein [Priestia aryabhattai]